MTRLPVVSGREAVRAFARLGYELDRQHGVTSSFAARTFLIDDSPFQIIASSRRELFGA